METPLTNAAPATPRWLFPARALLTLAILGAGYLVLVALSNGPVAGCGPGSGCDKVLQSRWAYWLNVPVSVPAVLVYLALLGALNLLQKKQYSPDDERGLWAAIVALSVIVAGAALWFVGLQVIVIKAYCKFCLGAHACGLTAAIVCLANVPRATEPDTPMWTGGSGKRGVPGKGVLALILIGLGGVLVLAGGQMLVQKERNVVVVLPSLGSNAVRTGTAAGPFKTNLTAAATNQVVSPDAQLIAPRLLSLYGGRFLVQLDAVPLIGSPDATNVLVDLFDYTCPHCRQMHPILIEAARAHSNSLAIACLPLPMATNCNPLMLAKWPSVPNSCEYIELSLAVFHANRFVHGEFHEWLLTGEDPPPLEQARLRAAQLVGTNQLEMALTNDWVHQQMLTDCELHMANYQATGMAGMPQLIMGPVISAGVMNSPLHLLALLERYLGLGPGK
jgi:uncharacterized membrane protein